MFFKVFIKPNVIVINVFHTRNIIIIIQTERTLL